MNTVYLALPISGRDYETVTQAINYTKAILEVSNFNVLHPMTGKSYLRTETKFKAFGYQNPVSTNHAIFERDKWMIECSDIALFDFTDCVGISIGMTMELAMASSFGLHTVGILPEDNPHRHAFVLEALDICFTTYNEALDYLVKLGKGEF